MQSVTNSSEPWEARDTRQTTIQRWRARFQTDEVLFALGVVAWFAATLVKWPGGLSFIDEIGYLGQARLFLQGHVHPAAESPGIWNATPHGAVAEYPFLVSVLLAPLFAVSPSAIFLSGTLAAAGLAFIASRILKAWGHDPCWGLIFLAHPTVLILSRTVMSDLLWSTFALGAWWMLHNRRVIPTILLLAGTMATRPTGILVGGAIAVGEVVQFRLWREANGPAVRPPIKLALVALTVGFLVVLVSNLVATGTIFFGYNFHTGLKPFAPAFFWTTAPSYLRAVLINPPLLLLGVLPLWRRRLVGPLLVVTGLGALMCFYFFVDAAPGFLESVILSERLILPVVIFMLVGYAALLAGATARLRATNIARVLLVIAPALIAYKVGSRHQLWQRPMLEARSAASQLTRAVGAQDLGVTHAASKAGLLYPGPTHWIVKDGPRPAVLLCVNHGSHYRTPEANSPDEDQCDAAGYRAVRMLEDGYVLMLRDDIAWPVPARP